MSPSVNAPARDPALEARLAAHLRGTPMAQTVYAFQRVASTMEVAHGLAETGVPEGTVVWAAQQAQGRGRLGRTWVSPEGGAYVSLVLRPQRSAEEMPQLALVVGLAAAETLRDLACVYPSVRWPNDLLINGKKVGGILVEAKNSAVVVGVGINVATDATQLPPEATSLSAAGAPHISREELIAGLCRRLARWYDVWRQQGFAPIREALRPWIGLFGHPVHLTAGSQNFEGTAADLDEAGRLLVRLDSGLRRAFDMGEVTLLK